MSKRGKSTETERLVVVRDAEGGGTGFLLGVMKYSESIIVRLKNFVNILKTTEFYTLKM